MNREGRPVRNNLLLRYEEGSVQFGTPALVFRPRPGRLLLFSRSQRTVQEKIQDQTTDLFNRRRDQLDEAGSGGWLAQVLYAT